MVNLILPYRVRKSFILCIFFEPQSTASLIMNRFAHIILMCLQLITLPKLYYASSKTDGSITPRSPRELRLRPPMVAYVQFDVSTLLPRHVAVIERALNVQIFTNERDLNFRQLWGLLHSYTTINRSYQFYS